MSRSSSAAADGGTQGAGVQRDDQGQPAVPRQPLHVAHAVQRDIWVAAVPVVFDQVPWGLDFLPDGSAVVTERDTRRVLHVVPSRSGGGPADVVELGIVDQAAPAVEGGLLGVAGVVALGAGGLLLFDTDSDEFGVSPPVVIAIAVALGAGLALIRDGGNLGVSVSWFDSAYGVPSRPGAEHHHAEEAPEDPDAHAHGEEFVTIGLEQIRADARGEPEHRPGDERRAIGGRGASRNPPVRSHGR